MPSPGRRQHPRKRLFRSASSISPKCGCQRLTPQSRWRLYGNGGEYVDIWAPESDRHGSCAKFNILRQFKDIHKVETDRDISVDCSSLSNESLEAIQCMKHWQDNKLVE